MSSRKYRCPSCSEVSFANFTPTCARCHFEKVLVVAPYPWNDMAEQIVYATTFARNFDFPNAGGEDGDTLEAMNAHAIAAQAVLVFRRTTEYGK